MITVYDELGNKIGSSNYFQGSSEITNVRSDDHNFAYTILPVKLLDLELQRNSKYIVKVGSPNNIEFTINTPKSQHNFVYECSAYSCDFKNYP